MDEKFYLHSKESTENLKEAKFEYSDLQIFKNFKILKLCVDLTSQDKIGLEGLIEIEKTPFKKNKIESHKWENKVNQLFKSDSKSIDVKVFADLT